MLNDPAATQQGAISAVNLSAQGTNAPGSVGETPHRLFLAGRGPLSDEQLAMLPVTRGSFLPNSPEPQPSEPAQSATLSGLELKETSGRRSQSIHGSRYQDPSTASGSSRRARFSPEGQRGATHRPVDTYRPRDTGRPAYQRRPRNPRSDRRWRSRSPRGMESWRPQRYAGERQTQDRAGRMSRHNQPANPRWDDYCPCTLHGHECQAEICDKVRTCWEPVSQNFKLHASIFCCSHCSLLCLRTCGRSSCALSRLNSYSPIRSSLTFDFAGL